jgi:hypothetical protein
MLYKIKQTGKGHAGTWREGDSYGDPPVRMSLGRTEILVGTQRIEINRGLHLDELKVRKTAGFGPLRTALERFMDGLSQAFQPGTGDVQSARRAGTLCGRLAGRSVSRLPERRT